MKWFGIKQPRWKICGSIGDHHSNSNKITNNGSEREEKLSRPRVRLAHAMDPFGGCPSCFMNNLGNRQRIIQDEKPSQAVLSVAGRCWKMLEARSFSHHPHHHTPGSVQILILDARVLIFYLLMPWWLRVVPWNHGLLDLWKTWLPHKAALKKLGMIKRMAAVNLIGVPKTPN